MIPPEKYQDDQTRIRISAEEIKKTLFSILLDHGFETNKAQLCARLFTETTVDGVYSHIMVLRQTKHSYAQDYLPKQLLTESILTD